MQWNGIQLSRWNINSNQDLEHQGTKSKIALIHDVTSYFLLRLLNMTAIMTIWLLMVAHNISLVWQQILSKPTILMVASIWQVRIKIFVSVGRGTFARFVGHQQLMETLRSLEEWLEQQVHGYTLSLLFKTFYHLLQARCSSSNSAVAMEAKAPKLPLDMTALKFLAHPRQQMEHPLMQPLMGSVVENLAPSMPALLLKQFAVSSGWSMILDIMVIMLFCCSS